MTKFLSECLEAPEPFFRQGLDILERSNGNPSTDIRMSLEIQKATKRKLTQLGLDPSDTTPEELYYFLQQKVLSDDAKLTKALRTQAAIHVSAEAEIVAGMVQTLKKLPDSKRGFAMKPAVYKSLVRQAVPKKSMKQLGYRSLDSFLKHESVATIMVATRLVESEQWQGRLRDQYKKLESNDFEDRQIVIIQPEGVRWRRLSDKFVSENHHNILSSYELATLVLLPLPNDIPAGTATASLSLALHELNQIRVSGTYLKLCQVRPDFAEQIHKISVDQPSVSSNLLDLNVPWHLIQRYYSQVKNISANFLDSHVALDDAAWCSVEASLRKIEPSFDFWRNTAHLAVIDNRQPVSFNLVDAALNCCNQLKFEQRLKHNFQESLWHELLLRYLKPEAIEQSIRQTLQPRLAMEMAEA